MFLFVHGKILGWGAKKVFEALSGGDPTGNGSRQRKAEKAYRVESGCTTIDFAGKCVSKGAPAVGCPSGLIARTDGSCVPPGPSQAQAMPTMQQRYATSATAMPGGRTPRVPFTPPPIQRLQVGGVCIPPWRRAPDGTCKIFAGQQPGPNGIIGDPWDTVEGSFGMPAMVPQIESIQRHTCPTGMVLGTDMLCYPKAVLRRDSKFRKWKPGARPVLTGGQRKAISKSRAAITSAKEAIGGLGVTVKKKC